MGRWGDHASYEEDAALAEGEAYKEHLHAMMHEPGTAQHHEHMAEHHAGMAYHHDLLRQAGLNDGVNHAAEMQRHRRLSSDHRNLMRAAQKAQQIAPHHSVTQHHTDRPQPTTHPLQHGAKGGEFYTTASGKRVYTKKGGKR